MFYTSAKKNNETKRDSNSSLKLLTFQLFNVKELETIKYAYVSKVIFLD